MTQMSSARSSSDFLVSRERFSCSKIVDDLIKDKRLTYNDPGSSIPNATKVKSDAIIAILNTYIIMMEERSDILRNEMENCSPMPDWEISKTYLFLNAQKEYYDDTIKLIRMEINRQPDYWCNPFPIERLLEKISNLRNCSGFCLPDSFAEKKALREKLHLESVRLRMNILSPEDPTLSDDQLRNKLLSRDSHTELKDLLAGLDSSIIAHESRLRN
jgi:hypothetical protein